jgi:lipid A 3-O-deacylase
MLMSKPGNDMTKEKSVWQRHVLCGALGALLALGAASAHADQFGVQLGAGVADHDVKKGDLGLVWDPGLQWWHFAGFHFTVVGEAHVAYWHEGAANAVNPAIWEFGVTPVFRIIKDTGWFRPFFEAGVGIRFLSHVQETTDRTMSTSFQFADMVGVGAQFGEHQNYQAGFRFQHLSNADIKTPNPGINFTQVYLQYNF